MPDVTDLHGPEFCVAKPGVCLPHNQKLHSIQSSQEIVCVGILKAVCENHCIVGMDPVLFTSCAQENLMALATSLSTTVLVSKGKSWRTVLEWFAWRWSSPEHFSIPPSPVKGKEGKPSHPVWSYWTCYHWLPGAGTGCLGFQKYDSKVVNGALLCGAIYYDFSIMLPILLFFIFSLHHLCNVNIVGFLCWIEIFNVHYRAIDGILKYYGEIV